MPDMSGMGWPAGTEAMDYLSPSAGTPAGGTPMSGVLSPFAGTPLSAGGLPFADITAACHQAPHLEAQVQAITSRVQKLERSRGQISKDIADMLSETRDLQKKVFPADVRKQAVISVGRAYEAPAVLEEAAADPPPGLMAGRRPSRLKTAPAPSLPKVPEEQPLLGKPPAERIPPPPGLTLPVPESLVVQPKEVDGQQAARVEWRIDNARAKFKDCVGRPLVSPQFEAGGLPELRLMVFPNLGVDNTGLTMREQKSRYEARIASGPLIGALKFKVVTNFGDKLVIGFNLFVGDMVQGPIEHNFADHIIHGVDFNNNWLDQIKNGSLTVGVEMLTVQGQGVKQGDVLTVKREPGEDDDSEFDQMSKDIQREVASAKIS